MAQACDKLGPMLRIASVLLLLATTPTPSCALAQSAADARRIAPVIGNDRYRNIPSLCNARADSIAVAEALRELVASLRGGGEPTEPLPGPLAFPDEAAPPPSARCLAICPAPARSQRASYRHSSAQAPDPDAFMRTPESGCIPD
jgi:hypothetical protein